MHALNYGSDIFSFPMQYPMGPSWCYLHAKSITVNALLEFREYKGRVPKQMNQKATKLFEVFSQPQVNIYKW